MNRKKLLTVVAGATLLVLTMLVLVGLSFHRITIVDGKEYVQSCPSAAQWGRQVVVYTAITEKELAVDGVEGDFVEPGVFVFPMPDRRVELRLFEQP